MAPTHPTLSIPAEDRVPTKAKAAYAMGGIVDMFGHYIYGNLAAAVFTLHLGVSPGRVGIAMMVLRLIDAFTDPLLGWISDNARTRWGRRRPFILVGSVLAGMALPLLFIADPSWSKDTLFLFMIVSLVLYAPLMSIYNIPYQSLGSELTPNYHERTNVQAWKNFVQRFAGVATSWAVAFATCSWFKDPDGTINTTRGAFYVGVIAGGIMILSGIVNARFVHERYYARASTQKKTGLFTGLGSTLTCRPFLAILGIGIIYAIPVGLTSNLTFYTSVYHVYGGQVHDATIMNGWASLSYASLGVVLGLPLTTWLSKRFGKRSALQAMLVIGAASYASSWFLYDPRHPWLMCVNEGFNGVSAVGFWVLLPSMVADVIDFDERRSGLRREGAFFSAFAWVLKVAISLAAYLGGKLVELTNLNVAPQAVQTPETIGGLRLCLALVPAGAVVLTCFAAWLYPLTHAQVDQIRADLEATRGKI